MAKPDVENQFNTILNFNISKLQVFLPNNVPGNDYGMSIHTDIK